MIEADLVGIDRPAQLGQTNALQCRRDRPALRGIEISTPVDGRANDTGAVAGIGQVAQDAAGKADEPSAASRATEGPELGMRQVAQARAQQHLPAVRCRENVKRVLMP